MAIQPYYYETAPVTFVNGTDENTTKQIFAFKHVFGQTNDFKIYRYGVYFDESSGNTTPSDNFKVTFFQEGTGGDTTSNGMPFSKNVYNLNDINAPESVNEYAYMQSLVSSTINPLDTFYVDPTKGHEVILGGDFNINTLVDTLFGCQITSGPQLATGNVSVICKVYFLYDNGTS